ncbi:MAG: N-acetylgalactosamine-6-sulfatase, partial [Pirellulales bacterium]
RRGNWKGVRNKHDGPIELYDLAEDVGEKRNVAADHPEQVAWFERYFRDARTASPNWPSPLDGDR